ncbi:AbrB/MazE/SpoVT family DNA-binding domain-containing protein [Moorella sulfitireducens]|uniref:AbrB/MazE/SpoVT family DNA-binding domain-containing protein n=1 Tax=Neomoorella sulfitireducens TaxID=2972948 RepID=UPI0021ACC43D|nr:AbrB/MazE/SpoVT family DNA-binding domain-containing protein [Moorella sulfitireducens]
MIKVSSKGQIVLPAKLREKACIKKGDILIINLVGNKVVIEPLNKTKKDNWQQILEETAGIWPHVDANYVEELRLAAQKRLEETL